MDEKTKKIQDMYENLGKRVNEGLARLVRGFLKEMDDGPRKQLLRDLCCEWL